MLLASGSTSLDGRTALVSDLKLGGLHTDDMHFFFIPGLPQQHVVKLRPGLETFLKQASSIYDLFIYTHGTRLYAEQIAKIIDPDDAYFHHRIVARTDTPDMGHKSLKLLFPSCDDSMIMVLDDRIDVWKVLRWHCRAIRLVICRGSNEAIVCELFPDRL
jgi:FCP1-like phosphatase family protein